MLFKPTHILRLSAIILTLSSHTALASTALRKEVRALEEYQFIPLCQQTCIAGDSKEVYNNVGDGTSVTGTTNCETKECFCVPSNEPGIAERVKECLAKTPKCSNPTELNGAMTFIGNWCGFPVVSVSPDTSTSPTPTITQPGYTYTGAGVGAATTGPCWDSFGYPITTAGCSTTLRASTTSRYYGASDSPTSTGTSSGGGGSSIGTIAGLAVLGVVLAGIFGGAVWKFYFRLLCCGC